MLWIDDSNIWTMYFTEEPKGVFDSNTAVSDTNSGGYIVTSRRSKNSLISVIDNDMKARKDMQLKLYTMICENMSQQSDGQAE